MNLAKININTLREMLKLSERKEQLLKELKELDEQIPSQTADVPSIKSSQSVTRKKKSDRLTAAGKSAARASRGTMKTQVLAALQEAGPAGIKIPDLAQKLGTKSSNLHVWFSNTGKKLSEIERIGAGLFRARQN